MKLIFMASAKFAAPSFKALLNSKHKIICAITQPDKPSGRGKNIKSCPIATHARNFGVNLYQPKSIRKDGVIEHIKEFSPDLIVVIAYGKILPPEIIELPKFGCINLHASLLPKYRGAAPINWAIINGEKETGVTTMMIDEGLDSGNIIISEKISISPNDDAILLHNKLADIGSKILLDTLDAMEDGTAIETPQDELQVTYAPILKKHDGLIDWKMNAKAIQNRIRGLKPWPGTFTHLDDKTIKVHDGHVLNIKTSEKAGTIINSEKDLIVACGKNAIEITEIQMEGKNRVSSIDFLRGYNLMKGDKFQ